MICVAYSKRTPCIGYMQRVGLKEQNDRMRAFAAEHDLKISKFYEDKSDDYTSETGYQELRRDGMKRKFELVIFESIYRFGITVAEVRNLLLNTFYMIGIHFIVIEDGIDSRKENEESLAKYLEEKNLEIMGRRSWNTRRKTDQFEGVFGTGNYGYRWDLEKKEFLVDEEAAKVIREIFDLHLQGMPKGMIKDYLEARKIDPPSKHLHKITGVKRYKSSGHWDLWAVRRILSEERYIGMTERDGCSFPAIISADVFNEIQSRKKEYGSAPKKDELLIAIKRKSGFVDSTKKLHITEYYREYDSVKFISVMGVPGCKVAREEVIRQVARAIRREKRVCKTVLRYMEDPEAEEIAETTEQVFRSKAKSIFNHSVEVQQDNLRNYKRVRKGKMKEWHYREYHDSMMEQIKILSDEFDELLERLEYRRKQYSVENEWIRRIMNCDENALTAEVVNEVLASVLIRKDGSVEVTLNTKGKEVFPRKWIAIQGGPHGKKE